MHQSVRQNAPLYGIDGQGWFWAAVASRGTLSYSTPEHEGAIAVNESMRVDVYNIIGSSLAVSAEDGQMLYDKIYPLLRDGTPVSLSFMKIGVLIPAFLNAAIGQLYGDEALTSDNKIDDLISYDDIDGEGLDTIERVIDDAKKYFKNPGAYDRAWKEEFGDEE